VTWTRCVQEVPLPIGRAFQIPIRLHWSFFGLLAYLALDALFMGGLFGVVETLLFAVALFGSVILHELGHALAARGFGIRTRDITLYPFGGVAALEGLSDDTRKELVIALAGPVVNAVLFGMAVVLFVLTGASWLGAIAAINLVMGVFNLLPAFPMDGGRVLRSLLSERLGFVRASGIASRVGWWFGAAFVGFGLVSGAWSLALVGGFVLFAGQVEHRRLEMLIRRGWRPPVPGGHPQHGYTRRWSVS
jgi:Zn-dependent protease